ncbi:hypothetical protein ZWY2020_022781 [Hordeum vulgare]|nr:hypothetical protein ZWY2020_022781 [Hordeum vulgare]
MKPGHWFQVLPREIRIIEREKRKRDQEPSRGSLVSSATPHGTRIIAQKKRKRDQEASRGSFISTVTPDGEPLFQLPTDETKKAYFRSLLTPRHRAMIKRMVQLNKTMDKCNQDYVERFGCRDLPVLDRSFVEKPFGSTATFSDDSLTSKIVSFVLYPPSGRKEYDGDQMLFACSGVALQRKGMTYPVISRFVTSKRLVTECKENRNRADNLRINVRLSNNASFDGFLGLYDSEIAIVTSFRLANVRPVDLHSNIDWQHDLVVVDIDKVITYFLPLAALRDRLEYLEKFTYRVPTVVIARVFPLHIGVFSLVASKRSLFCIFPTPIRAIRIFGGKLLNTFEEDFGQLYGYKDYDCNLDHRSSWEESSEGLYGIRPENIFCTVERPRRVSFFDGCFVGMNFYGETDVTPYLPRRIIVEVLTVVFFLCTIGTDHATDIMVRQQWPVPKPYWYHP